MLVKAISTFKTVLPHLSNPSALGFLEALTRDCSSSNGISLLFWKAFISSWLLCAVAIKAANQIYESQPTQSSGCVFITSETKLALGFTLGLGAVSTNWAFCQTKLQHAFALFKIANKILLLTSRTAWISQ